MKKYLSILIIAIVAVTVLSAAGVVTTQKAAAQPPLPTPTPIVIQYQPGKTYTYLSKQLNVHSALYFIPPPNDQAKHFEAATGGAAYSSVSTRAGPSGISHTFTGVYWQLTGSKLDDIKDKPCKITVKLNYLIKATGDSWASVAAPNWFDSVHGNDPVHSKSVIKTTTFEGYVHDVFWQRDENIIGYAVAWTYDSVDTGAGQASAALVCSSIVLEFPQVPG